MYKYIVSIYTHLDCDNGTDDIDCINRCHCLNNYPCNSRLVIVKEDVTPVTPTVTVAKVRSR